MANLGSFAGGLAQGYISAEKIKQSREELKAQKDYNDRRAKLAEQEGARAQADHDAKVKDRDRKESFLTERKKIWEQHFGTPATPAAPGAAGPTPGDTSYEGGPDPIISAPTVMPNAPQQGNLGAGNKPAAAGGPNPLTDPTKALAYMTDMAALDMRENGDPKTMAGLLDYVQKNRENEEFQLHRKAFSGDKAAFAEIVKRAGGDPAAAKIDMKGGTIDFGNGQGPQSLGFYLRVAGAGKLADAADKDADNKREGEKHKADLELRGAQVGAQKANAARDYAGANLANKKASLAGAALKDGFDAKEHKLLLDASKAVTKRAPMGKDNRDGKALDGDMQAYVMGRAAALRAGNSKMTPAAAASTGADEWNALAPKAEAWVRSLPKDKKVLQARFGTDDPIAIRNMTIRKALAGKEVKNISEPTATNVGDLLKDD